MKLRIDILPEALDEALEAMHWYEEQREGLGVEFEQTLEAAMASVERYPDMYPMAIGDVRRCLIGRFPYGLFYKSLGDAAILIVAVFHASRDPSTLRERIRRTT